MAESTDPRPRTTPRWRAEPDHQIPPPDETTRPGLGELLRQLANDVATLVRQEIELAKMEVGHTAKRFAIDGAWIAVGALVAGVGGLCLVLAMALGLGALLDSYWLGTLITGLVLVLLGLLFVWKGARDMGRQELKPVRTVASLREDADWAKNEVQDFKNEITKG